MSASEPAGPLDAEHVERIRAGYTFAASPCGGLRTTLLDAEVTLRASGALDMCMNGVRGLVTSIGWDPAWVNGLPTMLMKPLSGSGGRAMMVETMQTFGPDSFAGHLSATVQGCTETTFYILAVYFGAVGIKRMRYAVAGGLVADLAGMVAAVFSAYLFFGGRG